MSRNYKEDQLNEKEALESIYCTEMEVLEDEPFCKFSISISTERFNEEDGLACNLVFTYTEKYPDEAPNVEIEKFNFEKSCENALLEHIKKTIDENLGMEMIFSLTSSAQEWLNLRWDEHKQEEEQKEERRVQESEEAERKRFEGTRVTVETFLKWKMEFEESTGIAAKRDKTMDGKKLTGKSLFLCDNTLNDSDLKFLLEAGDTIENVKIDESLFQNLNDLELESEDDENDEDWVPGKNN